MIPGNGGGFGADARAIAGGMDPRDPWRDAAEAVLEAAAIVAVSALCLALVRCVAGVWGVGR